MLENWLEDGTLLLDRPTRFDNGNGEAADRIDEWVLFNFERIACIIVGSIPTELATRKKVKRKRKLN
ncbi:MAG: hypothetical protein WCE81_03825 [Halobacteriota archaeon]